MAISHQVAKHGGHLYLVGGSVRDALMGQAPKDFDIEVHHLKEEHLFDILSQFGKPSLVGKSFGIILVKIKGEQFDFALPRKERKVDKGHKGFSIETDPFMGFSEAASRRDFTLNAMGVRLPEFELEDPWNGYEDLQKSLLRHIGPAFSEDPLRALRAVQFAARFEFDIDAETQILCSQQDMSELSKERFEEEFRKLLLKSKRPSLGIHWIQTLKLVRFFPELDLHSWELNPPFTLDALDAFAQSSQDWEPNTRLLWLHRALASAMHSHQLESWLARFTTDRKLIEAVFSGHRAHVELPLLWQQGMGPGPLRRLSLRFPLPLLCLYTQAFDQIDWTQRIQEFAVQYGCWESPPSPLVQGRDLIQLGHKPGKAFGYWLGKAFDLQLDNQLCTFESALEWIRNHYNAEISMDMPTDHELDLGSPRLP